MASSSASAVKYRYSQEIAQMVFVLCDTKDPEDEVVQYIEDIVRTQLVDIFAQGRAQANRRGARYLAVEDLLFLIRHDRSKVNRLRTYLSWKDVRKKVKDSEADEAPEIETMEEPANDKALKVHKMQVKIPWDIMSTFSESLQGTLASSTTDSDVDGEAEGEEDEIMAFTDNKVRLKEADELTKAMTKEQYLHYADCRQASFTYRKAKRFREFLNFNAYTDGIPSDEIIDILGFIAYEIVRSLCEAARVTKGQLSVAKALAGVGAKKEEERGKKRDRGVEEVIEEETEEGQKKRKEDSTSPAPTHRRLPNPISIFSEPVIEETESISDEVALDAGGLEKEKASPIKLEELSSSYTSQLHDLGGWKGMGMRNWRSAGLGHGSGGRNLATFL